MEKKHGKFQQWTLKFDDLKGLPSSLPASNRWSTSHPTPFPPWSPPTPQSTLARPQAPPVDPSKAVSPEKKGVKTNHSSRLTKGVPKKKTEQISATPGHSSAGGFGLHLLGLELGLLLLLLALEPLEPLENSWKTSGDHRGWTEHFAWDAQSCFGGGSWATQVSEIPL